MRKRICECVDEDTGEKCKGKAKYKCPLCGKVFCELCAKVEWMECPFCEPPGLVKI